MLNPKWYEGMLKHGYEGVRQIEAHVTNTMGWSATTGQVDPWVYEQLTANLRSRSGDAGAARDAQPGRLDQDDQPAHRSARAQLLVARRKTLAALLDAGDELEDRLEGVTPEIAA